MDLSILNEMQKKAVLHTEGALLVMAGAGSGKTRVLTKRIEYLITEKDVRPYHILALTFTNKAANEMKFRLAKTCGADARDINAGTFHSICSKILRVHAEKLGYTSDFLIYDSSDQLSLVKNAIKELNIDDDDINAKAVLSEISNAKNRMLTAENYIEEYSYDADKEDIMNIYSLYEKRLKEYNAMDFDDLILNTIKLFQKNEDVLDIYRMRYEYVHVDEYQDTNMIQYIFISLVSSYHKNIFVVGDQDQSIYSWRGADIRNITDFESDFEGAETIVLEENYRSTKNILSLANEVIKHNSNRVDKNLWTSGSEGYKPFYYCADNEKREAQFVVNTIYKLIESGHSYSDIAVLYRTNAQSLEFESAFKKYGIPHKLIGGLKFYDRKEIKDLISYLRAVSNSSDIISYQRIINRPLRGIGNKSFEKLVEVSLSENLSFFDAVKFADKHAVLKGKAGKSLKSFISIIENAREIARTEKASDVLKNIILTTSYRDILIAEGTHEAKVRVENIDELVSQIMNEEKVNPSLTLGSYLEDISLSSDQDQLEEEQSDSVYMMTLHTAKGLEFNTVFLVGLEENIFPSSYNNDEPKAIEEERRLCYVGITRAMQKLFITHAEQRYKFGKIKANDPSRFLDEMPDDMLELLSNKKYFSRKIKAIKERPKLQEDWTIDDFEPGTKVSHKLFGEGTVIKKSIVGDDDLDLLIAFTGRGLKTIRQSLAGLKIIH